MKRVILITALIAVCFMLSGGNARAEYNSSRPRIAFIPFTPQNLEVTRLMERIPTVLMTEIEKTGYFEVMEKKKIERITLKSNLRP